jgi:hypothetical protein
MRWTCWLASDEGRPRRTSEIVWSRPPDAEVKRIARRFAGATVANKPGTPRRARISRKTIAQGVPVFRCTCGVFFCMPCRGCHWCIRCSLRPLAFRGTRSGIARTPSRRGDVKSWLQSCRGPSFETPLTRLLRMRRNKRRELDPHGEEARSAVSNHEAPMSEFCCLTLNAHERLAKRIRLRERLDHQFHGHQHGVVAAD